MVLIFEQGTLETKKEFQSRINEAIRNRTVINIQMTEDVNNFLTISILLT